LNGVVCQKNCVGLAEAYETREAQQSITAAATELLSHPYKIQSIFQKLIPIGLSDRSGNIRP